MGPREKTVDVHYPLYTSHRAGGHAEPQLTLCPVSLLALLALLPCILCSRHWVLHYSNQVTLCSSPSGPSCLLFLFLNTLLLQCSQLLRRTFSDTPRHMKHLPTVIRTCVSFHIVVKILEKVIFVSKLDLRLLRAGINSCPTVLQMSKCGSTVDTVVFSPNTHPSFLATEPCWHFVPR